MAKEQTLHSANIAITGRHALHSVWHVSAHSPCQVRAKPSSSVYMWPCLTKLTTPKSLHTHDVTHTLLKPSRTRKK